jgi:hypothetical protein
MAKRETPVQATTKRARALVKQVSGNLTGITVTTRTPAASTVTYPAGYDHAALKDAATAAGARSVFGGEHGMTINWM